MELWAVRHGETDFNAEGRIQGQLPVPLSALGRVQAEHLAERLRGVRFDAFYASDLARTRETAETVERALKMAILYLPALREIHYGIWQGLTADEVAKLHPEEAARRKAEPLRYLPPGGESWVMVGERVVAEVERLAARHAGERVLMVSHGGPIISLVNRAWGRPLAERGGFSPRNTSVTILEIEGPLWRVRELGSAEHLEALGPDGGGPAEFADKF